MQPNTTTTENNTKKIKEIIDFWRYNEVEQELLLCKLDVHSDNCSEDWRNVLEYQNWTALRTLDLSNTAIT